MHCGQSLWILHSFTLPTLQEDLLHSIMPVFVPGNGKMMTFWISVIVLLSVKTGLCMKQTGTCRPFCTGSDCITLNQERVDFKGAQEACHNRNGDLVTFQSETDTRVLDSLSQELDGDFWIGLSLPAGACSNFSTPLRGYEWTSGASHRSFVPSTNTWKDSIRVCSPQCVSVSNDQKWTERPCSQKTDGFLCRTKHKDACQAQELSDPTFIASSEGCASAPCEHKCTDVKGGYKCSCSNGYITDTKDPQRCELHCDQQKCPARCDRHTDSACFCPGGFIINGKFCEDIDECKMKECDHECTNTYGSFVCSCRQGFVLKDHVKCVAKPQVIIGAVKPAANNNTLKGSSAPASGFLWIWIFIVVAVAVLIIAIRCYVVKRRKRTEQNSVQQSAAPVDNIECSVQATK